MSKNKIIGVDIGGTTITAGLVIDGKVENTITIATEPEKSKEGIRDNLFKAIKAVNDGGARAIGIGVPGLVDSEKGNILQITNIPSWNEYNLKLQVEKEFGLITYLENDSNCFVLGVKYYGAGYNYKNIIGIILGTGLGSGIMIDNKLYKGLNNAAGELCFLPYKDSNLEKYCSGRFFTEFKKERGEELYRKALKGDIEALEIWNEYGVHISQLVRVVLLCYAPQMIAFGGSVTNGYKYFKTSMEKNLESFELKSLLTEVKIIKVDEKQSAVLGAAALAE